MAESLIAHPQTLLFALLGGILPALLWLRFWLREDGRHPEPPSLLMASFLSGMAAVFLAAALEQGACFFFQSPLCGIAAGDEFLAILLAFIEEMIKFLMVFLIAFHTKFFDEPVDALIYLITAALGFAAMENALYLFDAVLNQGILTAIISGNLRFIGATVLHVAASSIVGVCIAFSFYRRTGEKVFWTLAGIAIAVLLHALFNIFIIKAETVGASLSVFSYVWAVIIIVMLLFERIKQLGERSVPGRANS